MLAGAASAVAGMSPVPVRWHRERSSRDREGPQAPRRMQAAAL